MDNVFCQVTIVVNGFSMGFVQLEVAIEGMVLRIIIGINVIVF